MKTIAIVFSLIGLPFLIISGINFSRQYTRLSESEFTTGTIIDRESRRVNEQKVGSVYHPLIKFATHKGDTVVFEASTGKNFNVEIGREVRVVYSKDNPQNADIYSFFDYWFTPLLLMLFGIIFFGVGFGLGLAYILKQRKHKLLKRNGTPVSAEVVTIEEDGSVYKSKKGHPFYIVCQWNDGKNTYTFESESTWINPESFIKNNTVKVYVDRKNPQKKYFVDLSFLDEKK